MSVALAVDEVLAVIRALEKLPVLILMVGILLISIVMRDF
jgi:hypothetical protein